jgi:hypothetical protein
MSACTVPISEQLPQAQFERVCTTCKFRIANQFVTKCPRCATKLSLAELCTGCFQSSACHSDLVPEKKPLIEIAFPK